MLRRTHRLLSLLCLTLLSAGVAACTVDGQGGGPADDDTFSGAQRPLFDLAGLACGADQMECSPDARQCFCRSDFAHQNYTVATGAGTRGHYLIVASDLMQPDIRAAGNLPAFYVDAMNADWETLGARGKADQLMQQARDAFGGNAPRWFVLNEISRNAWNQSGAYRAYVGDLAQQLNLTYHRTVLVFSPFWRPGFAGPDHPAAWQHLAANARIAVENYLSGAEIAQNGFSQDWCKGMYQQTIEWYGKMGVGAARLVLAEHFAQTETGAEWGRAGISADAWQRAIRVRTLAARSLPFYGYASYAWAFNQMGASDAQRRGFQDLYHQLIEDHDIAIPPAAPPDDGAGAPPTDQPPPDQDPPPPPADQAPPPASGQNLLAGGDALGPGQVRSSSDGRFTFAYQPDGNLVLYQDGAPLWATNTGGTSPGVAAMQDDGNLVVYDGGGVAVWSSRTYGHPGAYLLVQDDGNTVIYAPDDQPLWATNTCCR